MKNPPFKMIVETNIERWRRDTFWFKECETIAWIKSFKDGDIFFDVGANIGIYSLYCAAVHPKCKIVAFEPDEKNYRRMVANIVKNLFPNIIPYPLIVSDKIGYMGFEFYSLEVGSSGGQMKERGSLLAVSIDSLPRPNHVKIDIDGQELKVVQGMKKTLKDKKLKSVLVEVDPKNKEEIVAIFMSNEFSMDDRYNKTPNHSRIRRAKEGINVENIIFTRERDMKSTDKIDNLPEKYLFRPDEVAEIFGVTIRTVYTWHSDGKLQGNTVTKKCLRFTRPSITKLLDSSSL